jgi:hypothetical protein
VLHENTDLEPTKQLSHPHGPRKTEDSSGLEVKKERRGPGDRKNIWKETYPVEVSCLLEQATNLVSRSR